MPVYITRYNTDTACEILNESSLATYYKINKAIFMVAIFGRQLGALATVYFRLKQFILDIYNGNVAYNADQYCLQLKIIIKKNTKCDGSVRFIVLIMVNKADRELAIRVARDYACAPPRLMPSALAPALQQWEIGFLCALS